MRSQILKLIFAASCMSLVLNGSSAHGGIWETCKGWMRVLAKPFRGATQRNFDALLAPMLAQPFRADGVGTITPATRNTHVGPIRITLEGITGDTYYALEPGKKGDPALFAHPIDPKEIPGSNWPYVAKDFQFDNGDLEELQSLLQIRDEMVHLGKTGRGPEVIAWDVAPDPTNPSKRYVMRIVTKNLAHGPDIIAAGSLFDVGPLLRPLPTAVQKAALIDLLKIQCSHNDPGIQNTYLVIRKDANAPSGQSVSAFYIDVGLDRGILQAILPGIAEERQSTPARRFATLQKMLLRHFPNLPKNPNGLVVTATDVLGDTELARQVDRELATGTTK